MEKGMGPYTVIGIDPGIVDTGLVCYYIRPVMRTIEVHTRVFHGQLTDQDYQLMVERYQVAPTKKNQYTFIEAYRPRSNFRHDTEMAALCQEIRKQTGGKLLGNTGIKKVVRAGLLGRLQSFKFATNTNHSDLESAARIAVLGMLKNKELNQVLSDFIQDTVAGTIWSVTVK